MYNQLVESSVKTNKLSLVDYNGDLFKYKKNKCYSLFPCFMYINMLYIKEVNVIMTAGIFKKGTVSILTWRIDSMQPSHNEGKFFKPIESRRIVPEYKGK